MKYLVTLLLLLSTVLTHAQRMVIENGNIYIESFGVRADLVSPYKAFKQQTLDNGSVRTAYHKGVSAYQNILVSKKFRIAKADAAPLTNRSFYVHSGLADGQDGRPGRNMVARASDGEGCDDYSEGTGEKGKWRVPTINEYMLMGVFLTSYNDIPGFTLPGTQYGRKMNFKYMSSTTYEGNDDHVYYFVWYPGFYTTLTGRLTKTDVATRVRCIMDVE